MKTIGHIEMHVTHACNLSCESCGHYANHGHKGMTSLEEAEAWLGHWSGRIAPQMFSLLGGEPTIHPELPEILRLARRHWPETELRVVTNGFFLHRHPDLPELMRQDPKIHLQISVHHSSPEFQAAYQPVRELLEDWSQRLCVRIVPVESFGKWTRRYKGFGNTMEPFEHGQPRRSWENCTAKTSPQLFLGKIWKCPPLAYLGLQDAKYELSSKWDYYLGYQPLEPGCTDEALEEFFSREDESWCGMCAAKPERFELPNPLRREQRVIPVVAEESLV